MKRVGIITKTAKNYGAVLQAYALKKSVDSRDGAHASIIKYKPKITDNSYKVCKYPWRLRGTAANILSLLNKKEIKAGSDKFLGFAEKYFEYTREYKTAEELKSDPPDFDVYITGSDQVWNPNILLSDAYFLDFVRSGGDKSLTSYAASIGLNEIPEKNREYFKEKLQRFDVISVREDSAKQALGSLGISCAQAPDPTLLLTREKWDEIAKKPDKIKEPYILCYFVSMPQNAAEIVDYCKKELGLNTVIILLSEQSAHIGDIKVRDAGPEEFIGLIKNAKFVITSSFHGTVFSILYQKPFISITARYSGRITELLEKLMLSDRCVTGGASHEELHRLVYKTDNIYNDDVTNALSQLRESGNKILDDILNT